MNEQKNLMPADRLPYLFQFDLPWKDEVYGDGTMEQTGCGPTSLAMALGGLLSQDFSPKEIADYAQANGYYVDGAGTAWAFFTDFPQLYGIPVWQSAADENLVQQELDAGNVLILSMGPGDFTTSGHIICAQSGDEPGSLNVHDPNSKNNSRKWPISTVLAQARAIFVLQNPPQ